MTDDLERVLPNTTEVDPRVRHFGPFGLMTDRAHTAEGAIAFVSDLIARVRIPPDAPEPIRDHLDALCELHRHGAFEYRFFAFVVTEAQLGLELALGLRFVEHYPNGVPFVERASGRVESVPVISFEQVRRRLATGYRLEGHSRFNGRLGTLLDWSYETGVAQRWLDRLWARHGSGASYYELTRSEGSHRPEDWDDLTDEQRSAWLSSDFRRIWEKETLNNERELRNGLAHRTSAFITSPIESARSIEAFVELIDAIWGLPEPVDHS